MALRIISVDLHKIICGTYTEIRFLNRSRSFEMITISLCMIVKNEEDVLGRCLDSIRDLVDEIIIVDTGSADRTKSIASEYTDRIYDFQWIDDFSAARNYAFSKASMEYCMWLDADDVIEDRDRWDFFALKQSLTLETDLVMMRYVTEFDEYNSPCFWYYRERLLRNNGTYFWQGAVHEVITPRGNIMYSDIPVMHRKLGPGNPDRNLNIYKKILAQGKRLDTRGHYYYARELYYHQMYEEAIYELRQFLSFSDAWIENKIEACLLLSKCYLAAGDRSASLQVLLKSLEFDSPRAEVCCEIGNHFLESGQYRIAIFWFETARSRDMGDRRGGFILPDCYHYIPALQLCVCYDKLGNYEKAKEFNDIAGSYKPKSPAVLYNKMYFDKKL